MGLGILPRIALIGLAALVVQPSGHSRATTAKLERIDAFQVAFGLSFQFDACGDSQLGEAFRRAILEKFGRCPFTDDAKSHFHSWTADESTREHALLQRYIADHGKLPDHLDGMKESCQDHRSSAEYLKTRKLLDQYTRREITADDIITDPCNVSPGAP
jgi:hypothetical protein